MKLYQKIFLDIQMKKLIFNSSLYKRLDKIQPKNVVYIYSFDLNIIVFESKRVKHNLKFDKLPIFWIKSYQFLKVYSH